MARVQASQLTSPGQNAEHPCVFREVTFNEKQVLIPDIDKLSEQVELAIEDE